MPLPPAVGLVGRPDRRVLPVPGRGEDVISGGGSSIEERGQGGRAAKGWTLEGRAEPPCEGSSTRLAARVRLPTRSLLRHTDSHELLCMLSRIDLLLRFLRNTYSRVRTRRVYHRSGTRQAIGAQPLLKPDSQFVSVDQSISSPSIKEKAHFKRAA
jgi:hypothetical protein